MDRSTWAEIDRTQREGMVGALTRTPVAGTDQPTEAVVLRRTPDGWTVDGPTDQTDSLVEGMVLADLLVADRLGVPPAPPARPARGDQSTPADEIDTLRTTIKQLEHALTARVTIEQAIGVLAERTSSKPRDAFERLRKVARSNGRKVHDLAVSVVASVTDPTVRLPGDLPTRSS